MKEDVTVRIDADTSGFDRALQDLAGMSERFGSVLTGALKSAVTDGKSLDDVLRQIATRMASMALDIGMRPLEGLIGGAVSGLASAIMPFAKGGIVPFANGGVVSSPTFFPAGGGVGLMGEAGPEAILPLSRTADGRLGVAAASGQAGPVNVTFNVQSPNPESFRKSEAQLSAMLARVVRHGSARS